MIKAEFIVSQVKADAIFEVNATPTKMSQLENDAGYIQGESAVSSVNGKTGDVVLTTSDIENTSDYATNQDLTSALTTKQDVGDYATNQDLATKQDKLTFDTAPTASSINPVTSDGIRAALDTKQDNLSDSQMLAVDSGITVEKVQNFEAKVSDVQVNGASVVESGVAYVNVPEDTNDLTNEAGFITKEVNNLTNYRTSSAQDEIDNVINKRIDSIAGLGRFLSGWDCTTGLATTNPKQSPYSYPNGSFFIVAKVGDTNYMPTGDSYTIGVSSTTVETRTVKAGDVYKYDGTSWGLLTFDTPVIAQFSNSTLGTILGSNNTGYISAQSDGTGKVVGFENLATTTELNTKLPLAGGKMTGAIILAHGDRKGINLYDDSTFNVWGGTQFNKTVLGFLQLNNVSTFTLGRGDTWNTNIRFSEKLYLNGTDINNIYATKSTTLAGYGITNAYTKTESDNKYALLSDTYTKTEIGTDTITLSGTYEDDTTFSITLKGTIA